MPDELLSAVQAAARLGVKRQTLYSYVSRGLLESRRDSAGRSRFNADDVNRLVRDRQRQIAPPLHLPEIHTAITGLIDGILLYRDLDACELALERSFEGVCELLWLGIGARFPQWEMVNLEVVRYWPAREVGLIGHLTGLLEQVSQQWGKCETSEPEGIAAFGRALISAFSGRSGPDSKAGVAGSLWSLLSSLAPSFDRVRLLDMALVLLADHELSASTFAVRVAAASRVGLPAAMRVGLMLLGGERHGSGGLPVRGALRSTAPSLDSGFGHRLHVNGDPRARLLLASLRKAEPESEGWKEIDEMLRRARKSGLPEPNVDFALAAMGHLYNWPDEGGQLVFAVARSAGWIAHAIEEYGEQPHRFRPRAVYTGASGMAR